MTVLGVVSGSGGVGCSSFAAALGVRAAARLGPVVVVDGDPWTGGLQVTMAAEHLPGHRWAHLVEVDGEVGGERLLERLPEVAGCRVLSGGRSNADLDAVVPESVPAEAFDQVLAGLERACELVVVDWGRCPRPGWGACVLLLPVSARGLADAQAWLGRYGRDDLAGLVTRGSSGQRRVALSVAAALDLPLVGHLTGDRRVAAAARRGLPPAVGRGGSVRALADALIDSVLAETQAQEKVPAGSRRRSR